MDSTPLPYERAEPPGLRARRGQAPPPPRPLAGVTIGLAGVYAFGVALFLEGCVTGDTTDAGGMVYCLLTPSALAAALGLAALRWRHPTAVGWAFAAHAVAAAYLFLLAAVAGDDALRSGVVRLPLLALAALIGGLAGTHAAAATLGLLGWHARLRSAAFARRRKRAKVPPATRSHGGSRG